MTTQKTHTAPVDATITIKPVIGGFVVTYPKYIDGFNVPFVVTEVTNTIGKAMKIVKSAATEFSLVAKSKDDEETA